MNDADRAIAVAHIATQHRIGTVDGPCYEALKLVLGEARNPRSLGRTPLAWPGQLRPVL